MTLLLRIASHSEIGPVRKNNQDSGYASPHLLVVADGMGGAAAGDLASAVAVDALRRVDGATAGPQMLEVLAGAMHAANDRIAELVDTDYALDGMGTTVTGALFDGSQFGLAHIGDSRAYLLHDARLERLTHDHSWVQSLVDDGKINAAEAAVHPHRSLLLRVLNGQPANEPDLTLVPVGAGDRLLLCSDGLCGLVDDPVIEQALRTPDLDAALRRLVDEALAEGGVDNITVILADVVGSDPTDQVVVLGAAADRGIPAVTGRTQSQPVIPADHGQAATAGPAAAAAAAAAGAATEGEREGGVEGDDEARYNPQPPSRRRRARPLVGLLVLVLVVGAGLASGYAWTRTQFYVGAAAGRVAIYRGLADTLPGIPLSRLYEVQPIAVASLPPYYQERVQGGISVAGLGAARQAVTELSEAARRCSLQLPTRQPQPVTPSPTAGPPPPATPRSTTPRPGTPSATSSTAPLPSGAATPGRLPSRSPSGSASGGPAGIQPRSTSPSASVASPTNGQGC